MSGQFVVQPTQVLTSPFGDDVRHIDCDTGLRVKWAWLSSSPPGPV